MVESDETGRQKRVETVSLPHHNRVVIMLVALCCLLLGVALGAVLRGIGSATSEDNRLKISSSSKSPDELSAAFARAALRVEPTVVNISVREFSDRVGFGREGTGSGVIVNPAGYIITNHHVVRNAKRIKAKIQNGREFDARIIGLDEETDLAVLKIDSPESFPAAVMGDSDKLNVGDWVLAIGSPFGFEQTVTAGIISAKDRVTQEVFQQFLQTDAAINPGNSGGPLVNLAGEVVGISTQIATQTGRNSGIGFALPSSTAVDIYNQLISNGRVRRGFLGVEPDVLTPQYARQYGVKDGEGVLVRTVTGEDSPAARAGIRSGDVIISINGEKVKEVRQLIQKIAALQVGSSANITYVRNGEQRIAAVKLEERPPRAIDDSIEIPMDPGRSLKVPEPAPDRPKGKALLGVFGRTLTPEMARSRGLDGARGMLVTFIEPEGIGAEYDIRLNDVITDINRKSVGSQEDLDQIVSGLKSGDDVVIKLVRRSGIGPGSLRPVIVSFSMP